MHKNQNWLHKIWPHFTYRKEVIEHLELDFSKNTGLVLSAIKHIEGVSKNDLLLEILSEEALKISEIEAEVLNRESVQVNFLGCGELLKLCTLLKLVDKILNAYN